MEKVKLEIEVAKECHELVQGLDKFVVALKDSLADGWQLGTDMPALLASAFNDLVPAMQGVDKLGSEFSEDKKAAVKALQNGLADIAFRFIK